MTTTAASPVTSDDVRTAAERIRPYARRTPLLRAAADGRPLLLKLEHLQLSGSFKLRGALNAMLVGPGEAEIVTASGGNHGAGVAHAASLLGRRATVYVPETAPEAKTRRIEAAGARLVRHGATYAEAAAAALAFAGEQPDGRRYVHAYDDPAVVAGQGTVGFEIVEDAPEVDSVVVAAGGGGLAAGTALGIGPSRRAVVVEPEHCRAVNAGLAAGHPVDTPVDSVAASALGATRAGAVPLSVLAAARATSLLVTDDQILAARDRLWQDFRVAAEPAAAAPFAAWLAGLVPGDLPCLVICGANTTWTPAA